MFETWVDTFRGQPLHADFSSGDRGYKNAVFTVAQCPGGGSGTCAGAAAAFVCLAAIDVDATEGAELSVGDTLVSIGAAASVVVASPKGDVFHVVSIEDGGGSDCAPGQFRVEVRPVIDYAAEGIEAGSRFTTLWHQAFHPGYPAAYLLGWRLAFARREEGGAQGRNLLVNGAMDSWAARGAPGWIHDGIVVSGAEFRPVPDPLNSVQCFEGEAGTDPAACISFVADAAATADTASTRHAAATAGATAFLEADADGDGTADRFPVSAGERYVLSATLAPADGDRFGLFVEDGPGQALLALDGTTTWRDGSPLIDHRYSGLPQTWARVLTIPEGVREVRVRYEVGSAGPERVRVLDAVALRELSTVDHASGLPPYVAEVTYGAGAEVEHDGQAWVSRRPGNAGHSPDSHPEWWGGSGVFLVNDPGSRDIVIAGDSWVYDSGSVYSRGYHFCRGLAEGMAERLGRDISAQVHCEGRGGETTQQLLESETCTAASPTGGSANCWNEQIARWNPLYTIVVLGTNDVRTGVSAPAFVTNMMAIGYRAQATGSIPIFVSPAPIENAHGEFAHMVAAHAYYSLLRRAVLEPWVRPRCAVTAYGTRDARARCRRLITAEIDRLGRTQQGAPRR